MELSSNEFIKTKIHSKTLKVITVVLLIVVLVGLNNTSVYYAGLTPFGMGLVFALLYIGINGYVLGVVYALSYIFLLRFGMLDILHIINVACVLAIIEFLKCKRALMIKRWHLIVALIFSLIVYVFSNVSDVSSLLATIVS